MKKLKIKKRMTSFLILAVMVVSIIGVIPKAVVYADNASGSYIITESRYRNDGTEWTDKDGKQYVYNAIPVSMNGDKLYMFCDNSKFGKKGVSGKQGFILCRDVSNGAPDLKSFQVNWTCVNDGRTGSIGTATVSKYTYEGHTYSYACYFGDSNYSYKSNASKSYGVDFKSLYAKFDNDDFKVYKYLLRVALNEIQDTTMVVEAGNDTSEDLPGSQDNPMEDKDIGTIVLKSHGFISTKNDNFSGDVSASYDYYFKYKDKTSSGFSISDNKYARTFIQIRVQNQCVLFESGNEDTVKEYYPHYGEFYNYKNLATENISNNTVKVSWGEVMSKWSDYTEHPLATNKKLSYRFMLRVICTDSLTVIPDESSGWYAGGWRSFIFDGDKFLEETNGHVDGDGNWSDDEDDGYNDSSDKTSHNNENKDDVDKILNGDSSTLTISNIKSFLDEVGNVPKAITKLFSFLPTWVTTFIGFGFVVLVALIIIKVIRG